MDQELALAILLSGRSALLTGAAGTGKTYLLNTFIAQARKRGKKVSVTATTGLAATHLGGNTIHSWSGIGVNDHLPNNFFERLSKTRRDVISKTDVLIIDEISMLHDFRLDMIDKVLRTVRENDRPFGGIQLVMSGDFFQLPPVNRPNEQGGGFVVYSDAWQELQPAVLYLERQYRQNDERLLEILTALRTGDVRRRHVEVLLARTEIEPPDDDITELHTVNVDVDDINIQKLAELPGEERSYQQTTTGSKIYVENLQRSVLAPENLVIKLGALVMAVKNSPQKLYANGSIGTVVDFEPLTEYPVVEFRDGRRVTMVPDVWELRDGERKRASISQVPLRLAWAITVHKSQGMTLDAAKIDLRKAFVEGMGYVALSRVRDLDNLYLYGINRRALEVSPDALAIDEVLRQASREFAERY
ncbi:AAA family ATPase [Candidatus Nanosynbacter sp. HMT-352]|uniref:ATP-dependent DNA helicase n=1 Tax=Candidatus Nanosynbacter sp. HMT-352 TaxID=2899133 RepID=UPI001FB6DB8A|nr:PIF1 family DEAD/DEAH box helicase [Candidatus Nanosynbacter sp. HMT-352]UOG66936.1 AAA family ATPase [Candidatus Nanosynbacter sp. HMT-352]